MAGEGIGGGAGIRSESVADATCAGLKDGGWLHYFFAIQENNLLENTDYNCDLFSLSHKFSFLTQYFHSPCTITIDSY